MQRITTISMPPDVRARISKAAGKRKPMYRWLEDLMDAPGPLVIIEKKLDNLAASIKVIDVKTWSAFCDLQKQLMEACACQALLESYISQKMGEPDLKEMIIERARLIADKLYEGWLLKQDGKQNLKAQ